MINLVIYTLLGVNLLVCILLTLLVLMQKPRSEGLGAAFGGNFTDSIFGAQTSDILTKGTIWLGGIFMAITLVLGVLYSHRQADQSNIKDQLSKPVAPISAPAATTISNTVSLTNGTIIPASSTATETSQQAETTPAPAQP